MYVPNPKIAISQSPFDMSCSYVLIA